VPKISYLPPPIRPGPENIVEPANKLTTPATTAQEPKKIVPVAKKTVEVPFVLTLGDFLKLDALPTVNRWS